MAIKCKTVAVMPFPLAPDDEILAEFDINRWLDTDTIAAIVLSAVDGDGEVATVCFDQSKSSYTNTLIRAYLKGGGTDDKEYIVKCKVTTTATYKKSWYFVFQVDEKAA